MAQGSTATAHAARERRGGGGVTKAHRSWRDVPAAAPSRAGGEGAQGGAASVVAVTAARFYPPQSAPHLSQLATEAPVETVTEPDRAHTMRCAPIPCPSSLPVPNHINADRDRSGCGLS